MKLRTYQHSFLRGVLRNHDYVSFFMLHDPNYNGYISRIYSMQDMIGPMGNRLWAADFALYMQLLDTISQEKLQMNSDYYNPGRNAY
jgi:hypothetical protein